MIAVAHAAYLLRLTNAGILKERLAQQGVRMFRIGDSIYIEDEDFERIEEEVREFREDMFTDEDIARILGVDRGMIKRISREGLLPAYYCPWTGGQIKRFKQEDISELIYRLEFSNPDWHNSKDLLPDLVGTADKFPGVEEWAERRKLFFES